MISIYELLIYFTLMKLMSKILNYRVILQPSLPAVTLAGGQMIAPAQAGIWIKFEDGLLNIEDEKIISMVKQHPEFNTEFWSIDNEQNVIAQYNRPAGSGMEPEHDITAIEFGHVGKAQNPRPAQKLTPETQKFLAENAARMATEMLHKMIDEGKLVYADQAVKAEPPVSKQEAKPVQSSEPKPEIITPPAPIEDDSPLPVVEESEPEPGIDLKPRSGGKKKAA